MTVHIITPYDPGRNLGLAYNAAMRLIPDGDAACFTDGDVMFLTPDFGTILHEYANAHPNVVLTCWTNRIHELSAGQLYFNRSADVAECIRQAQAMGGDRTVTRLDGCVSGFLLVVPKSVWELHPFAETNTYRPGEPNLLGCDNEFTNRVRAAGVEVLRCNGLYVWHSYRLLDGSKNHLL